jgi:hypothetical protein
LLTLLLQSSKMLSNSHHQQHPARTTPAWDTATILWGPNTAWHRQLFTSLCACKLKLLTVSKICICRCVWLILSLSILLSASLCS